MHNAMSNHLPIFDLTVFHDIYSRFHANAFTNDCFKVCSKLLRPFLGPVDFCLCFNFLGLCQKKSDRLRWACNSLYFVFLGTFQHLLSLVILLIRPVFYGSQRVEKRVDDVLFMI